LIAVPVDEGNDFPAGEPASFGEMTFQPSRTVTVNSKDALRSGWSKQA